MLNTLLIWLGLKTETHAPLSPERLMRATLTGADRQAYRWVRGLESPKH